MRSWYRDLSVEHILIGSGDFVDIRQRFYDAENGKQLFQRVRVTGIFDFLQEIRLFNNI